MTTTFENARVGDKVWDFYYGWGKVTRIDVSEFGDTMAVLFDSEYSLMYYTTGEPYHSNQRTLFWDEIKFEVPVQPPRMKLIHGVEVPDISFEPKFGEFYYTPDIQSRILYNEYKHGNSHHTICEIERSLCYPYTEQGKQAAILHAKAMLGIKE
jgi:hypothetical protein